MPVTVAGVELLVVVPLPSCPSTLRPQAATIPDAVAHAEEENPKLARATAKPITNHTGRLAIGATRSAKAANALRSTFAVRPRGRVDMRATANTLLVSASWESVGLVPPRP